MDCPLCETVVEVTESVLAETDAKTRRIIHYTVTRCTQCACEIGRTRMCEADVSPRQAGPAKDVTP